MSNAVLATPLNARSLIQASAGTGKTHALAGLFARAVIVERLRVPQVLAVTYTVAATQELHARVRQRLQRAAELAVQWQDSDSAADDGGSDPLRGLLHAALHDGTHESLPALRQRLARAMREMDLAAIATIHGFCQRILREHALDTGQPLVAAELQPDNAASRRQLAVELWREWSAHADGADFLHRAFEGIAGLADALRDLLAAEPLLPPAPPALPPDPRPRLHDAWHALRDAFEAHGEQAHAEIVAAIADKTLKNSEYKTEHADALWGWLQTIAANDAPPSTWHGKCEKYIPAALRKGTSKDGAGRTPRSPLFEAIASMLDACAAIEPWREAGDLQRLHALRESAIARDRARKQAGNVRSYDDLVGAVFEAVRDPHTGPRLAQALRTQFPLVLVDEFQDTDARQWAIFDGLFGGGDDAAGGLVLVGDPKQAIYRFRGGDVQTYLQARSSVQAAAPLSRNYRSRPAVIGAINALFADAPIDGLGEGIEYAASTPGGNARDDDYLIDSRPAPALAFHVVPDNNGKPWNKDESIKIAATLCAQAIGDRLGAAGDGHALRRDRQGLRPLEPRDCAVLVRTHDEAIAVRTQLARLGVPAVAAGRQSLYATEQAQQLLTLLLALSAPGDDRRLRAALATRLLGLDATMLRALEDDGDALRDWQRRCDDWRLRWQQHGPQAMLADVVAQQAVRLLALVDGERQLTHLLQLGELLQEARVQRLGTRGQIDWLRAAIANADRDDEAQLPRLESDASRVQILTLHTSKGLEFPLVFLPFVGLGRGNGSKPSFVSYHDDAGVRVRQWKTTLPHPGALPWPDACARAEQENREEDMRLLYVGLTRARDAVWLCGGALASANRTALHRLLGGNAPGAAMGDTLGAQLQIHAGMPDADDNARLPRPRELAVPPARVPRRRLSRDWWIHSFSQLHRQQGHGAHLLAEDSAAADERQVAAVVSQHGATYGETRRFGGARFGNVLHHALEHADFVAWRDHAGAAPPSAQREVLVAALDSQGYPGRQHADGIGELVPLIARTLNASLPEGVRLCEQAPAARIVELEFHFALRGASSRALLDLLQAHGIALGRADFGHWTRLSGLMNGKIDLTYRHNGRFYVLDYKSNLLPAYDQATLAQVMASSEYDLQALLYVVAVHRWLCLRLGAAYDFDTHFGGVRYLFCRGLQHDDPAAGVFVPRIDRALVEAVDGLLAPAMAVPT